MTKLQKAIAIERILMINSAEYFEVTIVVSYK